MFLFVLLALLDFCHSSLFSCFGSKKAKKSIKQSDRLSKSNLDMQRQQMLTVFVNPNHYTDSDESACTRQQKCIVTKHHRNANEKHKSSPNSITEPITIPKYDGCFAGYLEKRRSHGRSKNIELSIADSHKTGDISEDSTLSASDEQTMSDRYHTKHRAKLAAYKRGLLMAALQARSTNNTNAEKDDE